MTLRVDTIKVEDCVDTEPPFPSHLWEYGDPVLCLSVVLTHHLKYLDPKVSSDLYEIAPTSGGFLPAFKLPFHLARNNLSLQITLAGKHSEKQYIVYCRTWV